jgi:hypothetical protein
VLPSTAMPATQASGKVSFLIVKPRWQYTPASSRL